MQRERLGRERVQHFRLGHRLEQGIAAKTTRIRRRVTRVARQSKAPKHFARLFLRIGTAWTIAVPDYRMHEETAVAGEQARSSAAMISSIRQSSASRSYAVS